MVLFSSFNGRFGRALVFTGVCALVSCKSSSEDNDPKPNKGSTQDDSKADDAPDEAEADEADEDAGDGLATTPLQKELEVLINREDAACFLPEDATAFDGESLSAAREAYADGEESIPLSVSGCTRMFVERKDGNVVSESLIAPPLNIAFDEETFEVRYIARLSTWTFDGDKGEQLQQDRDGDGFFELKAETVYGKQTVVEQFALDGTLLGRQTTSLVADDNAFETLSELYVDGDLADSLTSVSPRLQPECRAPVDSPPPMSPAETAEALKELKPPATRDCSEDESKAIDKALGEALSSVMGCLSALHPGTADVIIQQHMHQGYRVHCGQLHLEREAVTFSNGGVLSGPVDIYMDPSALQPGVRSSLASTIFHELMHTNDTHDAVANSAAGYDNLALIDPIYACEKVCMGSGVNECHLAACLGEKLSETWVERSGKLRSCSGRTRVPGDMGSGFGGLLGVPYAFSAGKSGYVAPCDNHQVGALCRKIKDSAEPKAQFCPSQSECNAKCDGECESYSLSCDKSCR